MEETKKLEILVIEDDPKHLQDAVDTYRQIIESGIPVNFDYATNYVQAKSLLEKKPYDGVITDIFFPASEETNDTSIPGWSKEIADKCCRMLEEIGVLRDYGNGIVWHPEHYKTHDYPIRWHEGSEMHPTGMLILEHCCEQKIPVTINSDLNHHGKNAEPVNAFKYHISQGKIRWVDSILSDEEEASLSGNDWMLYQAKSKNWSGAYQIILSTIFENQGCSYEEVNNLVKDYLPEQNGK